MEKNIIKKNVRKNLFVYAMVAYPVLHFFVFNIYVNISTLLESFRNWNMNTGNIDWVGLMHYKNFFSGMTYDVSIRNAVINTLLWIPLGVCVMLPISLIVAFWLSKKIRFYKFYQTVFFFANVISIVVTTMAFSFMVHPTIGVLNRFFGAVGLENLQKAWLGDPKTALATVFFFCVWAGFGMYNIMFMGAISRIPNEIYEVGMLDGISKTRELIQVIVPIIWPTISTLVIMSVSASFAVFIQPQLLTNGGPNFATTTVALYIVKCVQDGAYGKASACGVILAIVGVTIVSIIKWFLERRESVEL